MRETGLEKLSNQQLAERAQAISAQAPAATGGSEVVDLARIVAELARRLDGASS